MKMRNARIADWCQQRQLPDSSEFASTFLGEDGLFISDEGESWDLKAEWPFSYSNGYWGGIARLICAFANTSGGVIIFGVHDKKRTAGHNAVSVNSDRLLQALQQLTGERPVYSIQNYSNIAGGYVTALLICPRDAKSRPFRFKRPVEGYAEGVMWVRDGHEVVQARPVHYPMLFCRSHAEAEDKNSVAVSGSLPPSPTTLKRFVGRTHTMDQLFAWLVLNDEPRTFLHGKGGSGKTSIAYEFARLLKDYGSGIRMYGDVPIESVVYLSAKERELRVTDAEIVEIPEPDFSSERSLYAKILTYGGWTTSSLVKDMDTEALKMEIREFLDMSSVVMIIDDVDTLTTKGVDAGFDFLYRTLARCRSGSKVLYTLRNAPSQSLLNSIEVPGLDPTGEYEEFVAACASQFGVEPPKPDYRDNELAMQSERRPLVVESIIALRRTCGSYKRAKELFDQQAGSDVRDYVFSREWDSLPADNIGRLLLIALAHLGRPASFSEIETILQVDASRITDAIGAVREMFLQVDSAGEESTYSLAELTKHFVLNKRDAVRHSNVIKERIGSFKRTAFHAGPEVAQIVVRVDRLIRGRGEELGAEPVVRAWSLVTDPSLEPKITEDPIFRSVKGHAAAAQRPAKLSDARENFAYAISMKYEPEFARLKAWYLAEKSVSENGEYLDRVTDIVIDGRRYSRTEKIYMLQRKASNRYFRGKGRLHTEPIDARRDLVEALRLHLKLFRMMADDGQNSSLESMSYARNTAFTLFNGIMDSASPWEFADEVRNLAMGREVYLDPALQPIEEALVRLGRGGVRADTRNRLVNRLKGLDVLLESKSLWADGALAARAGASVRQTLLRLKEAVPVKA
ncbi:MAG: RNA-binding domain-containing protein [Brevundimonas sp.]|jgi:hypothetical protein|uniref:RNA-binding domain-containing protein n=1 Tax=Brevundimonas sp. TaxID=1871086 RepID=UPI00391F4B79